MPPLRAMRLVFLVLLLTASLGEVAHAQNTISRLYSRPELPSREALARLNLRLNWSGYVPTEGTKDAVVRIALLDRDLIALTRSGIVQRMDAETGKVYWRTTVGKPYTLYPYVAANSRSIYVIGNAKAVSIDRNTGRKKWEYDLTSAISAGPAVDEEQVYIPYSTSRISAYYLPFVVDMETESGETELKSSVYGAEGIDRTAPLAPRPTWSEVTNLQLPFRPILSRDVVFIVSPEGQARGFSKIPRDGSSTTELYSVSTEGRIRVAPTSFGDTAYIGSDDAALYAINMRTGKLQWRHTAGTAVTRTPTATNTDVYVTSDREGLARLDRDTGEALWRIPSGRGIAHSNVLADQFLAANERFVYASDHSGRLLVLDRKRGTRLSMLDTTKYKIQVVNDVTDRLYLAANDGLIVCLHDRDVVTPIRHRKKLEDATSPILLLLNQKITEVPGKEMKLSEAMLELRKRYKLGYAIAVEGFKLAGVPDINDKLVKQPRSEDKPLRDHLQRLLKPIGATFRVEGQSIVIIPIPKAEVPE